MSPVYKRWTRKMSAYWLSKVIIAKGSVCKFTQHLSSCNVHVHVVIQSIYPWQPRRTPHFEREGTCRIVLTNAPRSRGHLVRILAAWVNSFNWRRWDGLGGKWIGRLRLKWPFSITEKLLLCLRWYGWMEGATCKGVWTTTSHLAQCLLKIYHTICDCSLLKVY